MFELARSFKEEGMAAHSRLQESEFASEAFGYSATRHQREVGTGYFDIGAVVCGGLTAAAGPQGLDQGGAALAGCGKGAVSVRGRLAG